jgi:hypothetical protein
VHSFDADRDRHAGREVRLPEKCAYCLTDTVEQLISTRGDVVASTVLEKAPCTRTECIGSSMTPR